MSSRFETCDLRSQRVRSGSGFLNRSRRHRDWQWKWLLLLLPLVAWYQFAPLASRVLASEEAGETSQTADVQHDGKSTDHHGSDRSLEAHILAAIALILLFAKVGGDLFERVGMPAVLGELVVGVVLGNFPFLFGSDVLEPLFGATADTAEILKILASIGVVLLLFEVGLESTVREVMSVGVSSLLVALLGVVAPMILGYAAGRVLIPKQGWEVHVFIGATLCATSVGITARVLKDLGRSQQKESRIILGAAVIDDVLGLIILAIVSGVIREKHVDLFGIVKIIGLAFGFLAAALLLGAVQFPRAMFRAASFLRGHGLLVVTALVFCFGFSWLASMVGLEPIIGAFAAGLILEGAHYRETRKWENRSLEDALAPLSALLVPIFFVKMGMEVSLESFTDPSVWGLAATITVMAIIGKQVCAFGVREPGLNKLAVGLGMIPRGEVGLIFANVGRSLQKSNGEPVIDDGTYSAVVVMVMITTMVTPPLLKWSLSRDGTDTDPAEP